jgi:hypothetical protein
MAEPKWVVKLLPEEGVTREAVRPLVLRRKIRYTLFRLKKKEDAGVPIRTPAGFKKFYSDQEWFDGWENFGVTWDIGDPMDPNNRGSDDVFEVVARYQSVNEEWDEVIDAHVKSDTLTTRKRARQQKMEETNGSEDNV